MAVCRIHLIALLAFIAALGCRTNSNFCEGANDNSNCSEIDAAPTGCTGSADCSGVAGVCKLDTGTCVECTTEQAAACLGSTPVCGAENTCRGCTVPGECASGVCLASGECANGVEVAYVSSTGTGSTAAGCPQSMPCRTIQEALATNKRTIKLSGNLSETPDLETPYPRSFSLYADPGSVLTPATAGGPIILNIISSTLARSISIFDLTLSGASGAAISMGVGSIATLNLTRVSVADNPGQAISALGGTLAISNSSFFGNQSQAITASGGKLTISNSSFSGNRGGAVVMTGPTTFQIFNNFFVNNGTDVSEVGAIQAKPADASSSLDFNTFVNNRSQSGVTRASGVICDQLDFVGHGNLFSANTAPVFLAQGCNFSDSFTGSEDPHFANPAKNDYHLTANTPKSIVDATTCLIAVSTDFEGEARPRGTKTCDYGADEYRP